MRARSSSNRLLLPLLVSVLLHLALLAVWAGQGVREPSPATDSEWARSSSIPVELEFSDAPTRPPPPAVRPPPVKEKKVTRRRAERAPPKSVAAAESPPPPPEPVASQEDRPSVGVAQEAPRRPSLLPSWSVLTPGAGALAGAPESHGRTLRPGDPELRPESKEEESEKLTARVQDWADSDTAEARARGAVGGDPYFRQMRGSLENGLAHTDGGTPEQLGVTNPVAGLMHSYKDAASAYGRTGSPGGPPPSRAPRQSEQLKNLFGNDPQAAHRIRAMVQAHESLEALASRGALFTVKLEVRHARNGALLGARIEEHSGNELFDAFVMKVVPGSLDGMAPPPTAVIRDKEALRTQWLVEGWHHVSKEMMESIGSTLLSGGVPTVSPLLLLKEKQEKLPPRFEYRARLLKVY